MTRRDDDWYRGRLAAPSLQFSPRRVVIDTDAANEIDDQFALTWALLSPTQLDVQAVYATPFSFAHRLDAQAVRPADMRPYDTPERGMQRSFEEIERVFEHLGMAAGERIKHGSTHYLASLSQPCESDAAADLVQRALALPEGELLYVLALGCVTNIASALLVAPQIAQRIVVVWTSGFPSHAPHINRSFNLEQDAAASRVLLGSGVPLVYLPGFHVGAQLRLSLPEVERWVQGQGRIGDYLHQLFTHNPLWEMQGVSSFFAHSWVMWDLICVAWMLDANWVPSELVRTPRLDENLRWQPDATRPLMREAYAVRRDAIFGDFLGKLKAHTEAQSVD